MGLIGRRLTDHGGHGQGRLRKSRLHAGADPAHTDISHMVKMFPMALARRCFLCFPFLHLRSRFAKLPAERLFFHDIMAETGPTTARVTDHRIGDQVQHSPQL
jgi:hypothetical protein